MQAIINQEIGRLLEERVIERFTSPWKFAGGNCPEKEREAPVLQWLPETKLDMQEIRIHPSVYIAHPGSASSGQL